jgi:hypothetical protein
MSLAIVLVTIAALALIFILRITVSRNLQVSPTGLEAQIRPIDIEAFRNLTDPAEDEYLRRRLPAAVFRTVRRERLRAIAAYVQLAGQNATVLVRLGQRAMAASNPHTVEAARQMVDHALLLRRNATFALLKIYLALAWPNSGLAVSPVLDDYERLSGSAMLLGRLQNPAAPVRISASL